MQSTIRKGFDHETGDIAEVGPRGRNFFQPRLGPEACFLLASAVPCIEFQLLREINANGTAVVMATHNLELVRQAMYRSIELQQGEIVFDSREDDGDDAA